MQLYSSRPVHAIWQAIGDLVSVVTVIAAIWISQLVRDAIAALGAFGTRIQDAGTGLATTLTDAGDALARVPLIGDGVAQPFRDAAVPADDLATAGSTLRAGVETLAGTVGTALWLLPLLLVLLLWWLPRLRFVLRARAGRTLARSPEGRDLLALRALVAQPTARVLQTVADPVGAFRSADARSLDALAALELRAAGVRPDRAALQRG